MDAFDSDALIYAAARNNELGNRVRALFDSRIEADPIGVGSVLLLPEVLSKPRRERDESVLITLGALLGRLDLRSTDRAVAGLATDLSTVYRLRAADAVHLATAVIAGADRFITNNSKDFPKSITEIDVTYPTDLPDPDGSTEAP